MQSVDLLKENPHPSEEEIRLGLEGNPWLHGLPQHREGRAARGVYHRRRCPVTATQERPAEAAKEIGATAAARRTSG